MSPDTAPDQPRRLRRLAEDGTYVDYTKAEYGVRKDSGARFVTSVRGLAFLTFLTTAGLVGILVVTVHLIVTNQVHIIGEIWWAYPVMLFIAAAAWINFLTEFRAARLRAKRGLPRPIK